MLNKRPPKYDRGASAVTIALAMVVILGMAAVAIDAAGFGFNERRQSQTAADTGVMAGALGFVLGESDVAKVDKALELVRANLNQTYDDAAWQTAWETCSDPDIGAVDVGTGTPIVFSPMPNPFASPGTAVLECVSQSSSYLRVVIPDQFVDTSFGKVIGFDQISTTAEAIARIETITEDDGLLPFGIPGGTGSGEVCLSTNPAGIAYPPCQGPSGGGFGAINSERFGDYFGPPDCGNPGAADLAQNVALGIDHFVDVWPLSAAVIEGVGEGDPHPGDATIGGYTEISYDQCRIQGGVKMPQQAGQEFPPNAFRVNTGFSQAASVEAGLISDSTYLGERSRLQNTSNPTQDLVKRRQGANNVVYPLDDRGPWEYLIDTGNGDPCDGTTYPNTMATDAKVIRFQNCLTGYAGSTDLFVATPDSPTGGIEDSPRFAWAPQYWHAASTTGTSWQPVIRYRMVFLGGTWYNCSGVTCGVVFYPDEDTTGEMCDLQGPNCNLLNLDQLSAWVLPDEAVPDSVSSAFPGGEVSPFEPRLFR